ncbi:MAG TPA: nickel pincer cofactor biosynthesis protein LarC [Desulfobacteria bacterium]|nr:nickel pincer cofactor biosynthesis protein LarC [Desulfobacteria bacterium]
MMKTLYLDCFAGISGDMFLGALTDLGVPLDALSAVLAGLDVSNYSLSTAKSQKNGITGTRFFVHVTKSDLHHRHLPDIKDIIYKSRLPEHVKTASIRVFENLAAAEAKIHGILPEQVHFHEVGAVDSLVDIIGTVAALDLLGVKKVVCSPLPLGSGFVNCAHGILPIPAPAALELLKGIPTKTCDIEGETVTPTGAALIRTLSHGFGPVPSMRIEKIGYGAGAADRAIPNLLRAVLGEYQQEVSHSDFETDFVTVIEANIDDMNPEFYEHAISQLFSNGAVDVYLSPVLMKKGRPGQVLTCLASVDKVRVLVDIILSETSTLGVRTYVTNRFKLSRETVKVDTAYGPVKVKLGRRMASGDLLNAAPEWEDCKQAALQNHVPAKMIYDIAKAQFLIQSEKTNGKP